MIIAINAGIVHTSKVDFQPKFKLTARGMLVAVATVANKAIEVVYVPVIKAIRSGNFSLIKEGNKTLQIAMPDPNKNVPIKTNKRIAVERNNIPIINKHKPNKMALSLPILKESRGAKGEMRENAIRGILVKKATIPFDIFKSSRIIPSNGPTDVIAGRKLKAIKITPKINRPVFIGFFLNISLC